MRMCDTLTGALFRRLRGISFSCGYVTLFPFASRYRLFKDIHSCFISGLLALTLSNGY